MKIHSSQKSAQKKLHENGKDVIAVTDNESNQNNK